MSAALRVLKALRYLKWRVVLPLAARLGLPQEGIARLRLPDAMRPEGVYDAATGKRFNKRFLASNLLAEHAALAERYGVVHADQWLAALRAEHPEYSADIGWALYRIAAKKEPLGALAQGEAVAAAHPEPRFIRGLLQDYNKLGNISRSLELARQLAEFEGPSRTLDILEARKRLLEEGFPLPVRARDPAYVPEATRVLYLLHNSLPHASGGYATRTHGLVSALRSNGWEVECATRLGYPHDVAQSPVRRAPATESVDGVAYHRLPDKAGVYRKVNAQQYIELNIQAVEALARERRPAVIHAASNHINGLTAAAVGRRLGVPSVYEVRGLWELTRLSRQPEFAGSEHYQHIVRLETQACMAVDAVITITQALKALLVDRGVPPGKIHVIPNGVDTQRFKTLQQRDAVLARELGLADEDFVVGFVGSMPQYEGLDDLLEALALLRRRGRPPVKCVLVGDGDMLPGLKESVSRLSLEDVVKFGGRVPHDHVERYYSVMDTIVLPRKPQPVCESVSPLKPFEAMAMGIPVIASDVAALAEIIADGSTGFLFQKGSVEALAERLAAVASQREQASAVGVAGQQWVRQERDWRALAGRGALLYQQLLTEAGCPAAALSSNG